MIRPATAADAPELARVFVAAWRAGYRGVVADEIIDDQQVDDWTGRFGDRLQAGQLTTVLFDLAGTVAGFARYGKDPDDPTALTGYLASLYVDPASAGRGIGAALLRHALDEMVSGGYREVGLWVFAANRRARDLYERCGFRDTGATTVDPEWGTEQARYRWIWSGRAPTR